MSSCREDVLKKKLESSNFENERIKMVANKQINILDKDAKEIARLKRLLKKLNKTIVC